MHTGNNTHSPVVFEPSAFHLQPVRLLTGDRHCEIKASAGSGRALHPDGSPMHRHQAFCDEEAKLSTLSGGCGRQYLGKLLEELSDMSRVNPAAGIGDSRFGQSPRGLLEIDGDAAARRRELDRIADEIPENLFQFIAFPLDGWKPFRMHDLKCHRFFCRDGAQIVGDQEGRGFKANRREAEQFLFDSMRDQSSN